MTTNAELVQRYFTLAPQNDLTAYFAQFADDAVVEDEGTLRRGIGEIKAWRTEVVPVQYTVLGLTAAGQGDDARVQIAGEFPGSPVELTFHFEFADDGRIRYLTIRG